MVEFIVEFGSRRMSIVSPGRILSLKGSEWLILGVGVALAASLLLFY